MFFRNSPYVVIWENNSYLVAGKEKIYGVVRKSEGESAIFKRGNFPSIIPAPFGNIAIAICYDARRRHFYNNIKDHEISLILFPHGSPSDPKHKDTEQRAIDYFCKAYQSAFGVPVVYANCKGQLDYMPGRTGKMMAKAGFRLNGMSAIYDNHGKSHSVVSEEIICWSGSITPQKRETDITFYGDDIIKGNWLFRKFVMQRDIRDGIHDYEKRK